MTIQICMPALSPTMTEGNLSKWLKQEGDTVVSGDIIAEIETDKATMEVEAVEEGVLGRILVAEGSENIAVNTAIAVMLEEGEDASALDAVVVNAPEPVAEPAVEPVATPVSPPTPSSGDRVISSPLARRMATQSGLDVGVIAGSGPRGRVVKTDVEAALASGVTPSAAPVSISTTIVEAPGMPTYIEAPNSAVRKIIAQRMTESKREAPHFYLTVDCHIDALLEARKELNSCSPAEGPDAYKISVNDFVIRAVALALGKVPAANASWTEAAILLYQRADISVAVAIDEGLITPIIHDAGSKGLATISSEMKDLAARARDGKLAPGEYQGGTFSISNLGVFGVKEFAAVINPPQGAILAVGMGEQRPVVRDGALAVATVMSCTLSADHRVVDGAVGAQFLAAFKALIEDPLTMLL